MSYAKHPLCPDLKLIILTTVSKLSVATETNVEYTAYFIEISLWIQTNDKIKGRSQLLLFHLYHKHMNLSQIYGPTMAFRWLCDVLC